MTWRYESGAWLHRPWWKVAINTVLRWIQGSASGYKWVVFTRCCNARRGEPPEVLGYGFGRVFHQNHP